MWITIIICMNTDVNFHFQRTFLMEFCLWHNLAFPLIGGMLRHSGVNECELQRHPALSGFCDSPSFIITTECHWLKKKKSILENVTSHLKRDCYKCDTYITCKILTSSLEEDKSIPRFLVLTDISGSQSLKDDKISMRQLCILWFQPSRHHITIFYVFIYFLQFS